MLLIYYGSLYIKGLSSTNVYLFYVSIVTNTLIVIWNINTTCQYNMRRYNMKSIATESNIWGVSRCFQSNKK